MAAASLPRPGVQVVQQFRAQTPTIITPQLVPCVVGVCKQIIELLQADGAGGQVLNSDALIQMPAFFISKNAVGAPPVFTGLDTLRLSLSVNHAPAFQITFSDPSASGLTPATVVSQINAALTQLNVSSVVAKTLDNGDDPVEQFKLQTVGLGQFQSIYIDPLLTDDVVADAFGIGKGQTYVGLSDYNNLETVVPTESFPDPRGNLSELNFELDTVRVFLSTGSGVGVFEASRTESFLRSGVVEEPATFDSTLQTAPAITYPNDFWGKTLILTLNGGTAKTYTFPDLGLSPADADEVARLITAAFEGLTVTHDTGTLTWTTDALGGDAQIQVGAGTANTLLGLIGNENISGLSIRAVDDGNGDATTSLIEFDSEDFELSAQQGSLTGATSVNFSSLTAGKTLILSDGQQSQEVIFDGTETSVAGGDPDLKTRIEEIVGLSAGGRIEVSDAGAGELVLTNTPLFGDESLVKIIGGTALSALDEGTDPAVTAEGSQNLDPSTNAVATVGTVDLVDTNTDVYPMPAAGPGELSITINGDTWTSNAEADFAAFKTSFESAMTDVVVTRAGGTEGGLVITSSASPAGSTDSLAISGTAASLTYLGIQAETVTGVDKFPTVGTETFTVRADENADTPPADVQVTLSSETDFATLKSSIDAALAVVGITVSQGDNAGIVFTGTTTGRTGSIRFVDDGGGGLALLGLTEGIWYGGGENIYAGAEGRGRVHAPLPGDDIYIDGTYYATVNQVAPGGNSNQIKIDRQVVIDDTVGARWFIQAKDLDGPNSVTRPSGDLQVGLSGQAITKHSLMRDFAGEPVNTRAPLYLTYTAIRQDTTALAEDPGLLRFDDTIQLEEALAPISASNPLALGLFFSLINAPGVQVTGLGVDAVSADLPDGTVEAYTRAVEYLEGFEVYGLAPLTHDETVAQVFNTHVNFMSEPEQRGERVVMWNPNTPTHALDTLVGSGTNGDALTTFTFDTKIVNLSALVQNAGISPIGTIPADEGLYLDISQDDKRYSIKEISGSQVTVRVTAAEFTSGSNDDNYYAEGNLPLPLIQELFSVRIRGQELVTADGKPDRNAIAETVNALGLSFANRRFWMTFPDQCRATIEGLEQLIEGYYMNAATVGAIGQQPPQQSFTNFPIAGFTAVVGSNDTFSEPQLDVMAGGGAYIFIQEGDATPIFARMALTTDLTSIETRTDSVNKVVDFTAKFMRSSLRNFIGRFNITQGFLDTLGTTVQGLFGFLVETGVLIGGQLDNIIQDEDARDTVLIDTTLDVPIPCNYIKLTLLI